MMLSLWARITGKDKRKQFPEQQGVALGRVSDLTVIFPYGTYADLPSNALLRIIAPGIAIPVTTDRPADTEQGEPVFFHPGTNTRIIPRNDESLDIETGEGGSAPVNINCTEANILASTMVSITSPTAAINGDLVVTGSSTLLGGAAVTGAMTNNGKNIGDGHGHTQANDSDGDTQAAISGVT